MCEKIAIEKIKHFISKDAFNIDGLGKKVVENFWSLKLIRSPQDIFNLDYTQISKLEGWGDLSVSNLKFSIDQSKRFKATVNVRLEIFKDQGKSIARASASRSQTLREDASPNLQSRLWYNLVELMMKSFDREMRHQINTHLKPYIS